MAQLVPLKNSDGIVTKWIGSASDIQSLKEQSTWLEAQVKDRTKALHHLNEFLQQSNEELQQFAHVLSHDLKEPIRKISTFAHIVNDRYRDYLPSQAHHYIDKLLGSTQRVFSLIDGVLHNSTLEASTAPFEEVNLNEIVNNVCLDLDLLIEEKNAIIRSDKLPVVLGAPVLLYQLFYNLINNALKFSRESVGATVSIQHTQVERYGACYEQIDISDNGIGFDQQYASKIFGTFVRLNRKDDYEGNGLGLSLCKKIIQRHGGSIAACGREMDGATFTVQLPRFDRDKAALKEKRRSPSIDIN